MTIGGVTTVSNSNNNAIIIGNTINAMQPTPAVPKTTPRVIVMIITKMKTLVGTTITIRQLSDHTKLSLTSESWIPRTSMKSVGV